MLLAVLIGIITVHILFPHYSAFWIILEAVSGVAFLTFLLRWAYSEVSDWWYTTYILTDKRIIITHGWLQPQRKEAPLDKIQQVYMDVRGLWEYILDYGDVILPTSAGPIQLFGIAHPRAIVDQVMETQGQYNTANKAPDAAQVKDETLRQVVDGLAKPTVIPHHHRPTRPPNQAPSSRQAVDLVDRFVSPAVCDMGLKSEPFNTFSAIPTSSSAEQRQGPSSFW